MRRDWYSFLSDDEKRDLAAEYKRGPEPLVRTGQHWGDGVNTFCTGDDGHAHREAARLFRDKFHAGPCQMGYYGPEHGGDPLPTVYERLRMDGYL